ncbi:MAG: glycosyltransferase family 4 protein [Planctomycetes bacterium]|nr:glycosyltransferase family 4 protein [Planctomycetota bacterium]
MRILLLCHGLPPDSVGGVEQHVDGLARALVAAGHVVDLYARASLPGVPQGERRVTATGNPTVVRVAYRWETVRTLDEIYSSPPMATALADFLAERAAAGVRYDVAHVHHLTGMATGSLQVLQAAGVPTVLTLHDYWLFCPRGQMFHQRGHACETATPARCGECLQATFPFWLGDQDRESKAAAVQQRALAELALPHTLVVPSERALPPFVALGVPRARFEVVENGVDVERLRQLPPPAAGPGPLRLAYFGTVMPSKGLHVLLDALSRLPRGTATLAIHGNVVPYHGDESYATRCFARLAPGAAVHYHGPYGLDELPRLLAEIDVLAAPALWHEAFGLTVREALAASRPVLVSRIGGLQDAVRDGEQGFVLPPGDVAAWAQAIERLAKDRGLVRRLAAAAPARARGFAAMTADLLAIYERAAARRT